MIKELVGVHPYATFGGLVILIVIMGYLEARALPDSPGTACFTWLWALGIVVFTLARASFLGAVGPVLAVIVLIIGVGWLVRFYGTRKKAGSR